MNQNKEKHFAYLGLIVYANLGVIIRYYTTFPCGSVFNSIHIIVKPFAIGFIVIGIGFALISFIFRNKELLSRFWKGVFNTARGVTVGFTIGWGSVSAIILIFNLCS